MCKINRINQNWLWVCGYKIISVTSMLHNNERSTAISTTEINTITKLFGNQLADSKFYNAIKQLTCSTKNEHNVQILH